MEGKHPGYYEAILQLRECGKEVISFVKEEVEKGGIHAAKVMDVKNGFDFYLADKNFAKGLGKKLREKFGGELKITASLWGRKEGKNIYRLTVLFRCLGIRKGDIVKLGEEDYEVKLMGKHILLRNTRTGKKVQMEYKRVGKLRRK